MSKEMTNLKRARVVEWIYRPHLRLIGIAANGEGIYVVGKKKPQ